MSGQSTTFTFVCDSERHVSVLAGLPNNDLSAIDDLSEDNMLYGSSRNNAMEWSPTHLIRKCGLPDLQHLQKGFDPATGATLDGRLVADLARAGRTSAHGRCARRLARASSY